MTRRATLEEARFIKRALVAGRRGHATLPQLATAHSVAVGCDLGGCAGELRQYILVCVEPRKEFSWLKALLIGIIAGTITHKLHKNS